MTDPQPPPIRETEFASGVGLARDDVKKMRGALLTRSEDWSGGGGMPVMLHASGQAKLIAELEKKAREKKEGPPLAGELQAATRAERFEQLTVARVTRNTRLLTATRQLAGAEPEAVTVRVKSTDGYKAGMILERCERQSPGFYCYQGKQPRRRTARA